MEEKPAAKTQEELLEAIHKTLRLHSEILKSINGWLTFLGILVILSLIVAVLSALSGF